ncbi:MAG TPA: hypothetical protein VMC06_04435 [Opitutaceae bacterium]|nr:hypothetical protein [Opitutaceae bacterium]
MATVPPVIRRLCYRPAIRLGRIERGPRDRAHLRCERFASFLAANNRKTINTDRQDALLMVQRIVRQFLIFAAGAVLTWIALESARAVGVF